MIKSTLRVINQTTISLLILSLVFFAVEPAVSYGASVASTFTITQVVTQEISFSLLPPPNVIMSPQLGGLTGGTSNGQTQFIVTTNNSTGYNVTLFASSSGAMINIATSSYSIPAYIPAVASIPDFTFTVPPPAARFGYTVAASTTGDVVQAFRNLTGVCNMLAGTANGTNCWLNASSTAFTILNSSLPTPASGATSTLFFRVGISANPNPVIPNGTYVATTTITASTN